MVADAFRFCVYNSLFCGASRLFPQIAQRADAERILSKNTQKAYKIKEISARVVSYIYEYERKNTEKFVRTKSMTCV